MPAPMATNSRSGAISRHALVSSLTYRRTPPAGELKACPSIPTRSGVVRTRVGYKALAASETLDRVARCSSGSEMVGDPIISRGPPLSIIFTTRLILAARRGHAQWQLHRQPPRESPSWRTAGGRSCINDRVGRTLTVERLMTRRAAEKPEQRPFTAPSRVPAKGFRSARRMRPSDVTPRGVRE